MSNETILPVGFTFKDYQEAAAKTAIYPTPENGGLTYPELGLIGEVGEVAELLAKQLRDGPKEGFNERLLYECGDILWMCAMIDRDRGRVWRDTPVVDAPFTDWDKPLASVLNRAGTIATNKAYIAEALVGFLNTVLAGVGFSLVECMEANIAKLASRQARGVLGGSGDDR